jgi:exonuclease SbcC
MQSLEELRESGRVVGLISHVEEMKQRISMQLLVSKDGTIGTQVKIIENIGG